MTDHRIYVWVEFEAKPGCGEAVAAVLARMPPLVRAEPGCVRYDVLRMTGESGGEAALRLYEVWRDEAAMAEHREYEHYAAYRADILPLLSTPPKVALLSAMDVAPA